MGGCRSLLLLFRSFLCAPVLFRFPFSCTMDLAIDSIAVNKKTIAEEDTHRRRPGKRPSSRKHTKRRRRRPRLSVAHPLSPAIGDLTSLCVFAGTATSLRKEARRVSSVLLAQSFFHDVQDYVMPCWIEYQRFQEKGVTFSREMQENYDACNRLLTFARTLSPLVSLQGHTLPSNE